MAIAPKISVVVPIHDMENGEFFLWRLIQSLMTQSFKGYELVITKEGKMAENTNAGIRKARGEIVKILYMDDYFAHKDSLRNIVDSMGDSRWLVTGCNHDDGNTIGYPHRPTYSQDIHTGNNTIGSPSVLAFRREGCLYFDENLSWLLDCDLYRRYCESYGPPTLCNDINVTIGLGGHQTSNLMPESEKVEEHAYMIKKHS